MPVAEKQPTAIGAHPAREHGPRLVGISLRPTALARRRGRGRRRRRRRRKKKKKKKKK